MQSRKRILFFVDWYYPAYKAGGPISSVRNLCLQLKKEFEVLVITGDRDLGDNFPLKGIKLNEIVEIEGVNVVYLSPDQISANKFKEIEGRFKPDIIHLNSLFSGQFTILPLKTFSKGKQKIVVSPRGMFGKESLKIKPIKKKVFFRYAKITSLFKDITWHATSEIEASEIVSKIGKGTKVKVANNVPYLPENPDRSVMKKERTLNLLSVGRLAPIKNFDFLLATLKLVTSSIRLKIVGPSEDVEYAEKCKKISDSLPENIKVEYLGGMSPAKLGELYHDIHLFITASKNENFGHSIAEALGHGCPVIVSDKTPWKNLENSKVGFDIPLSKEKYVEKIEYFASLDQESYNEYCINAREYAKEIANPKAILDAYRSLYEL